MANEQTHTHTHHIPATTTAPCHVSTSTLADSFLHDFVLYALFRYDNRRTKMNKDGKLRRVEDARLQHLYNNFSDASALYTTTAVPFDVKPLAVPVVPSGGLSAMQMTPMAQSAGVHPFLHAPMMAASAQQDEAWKRMGGMQDAQQQLFQAQLQFHMTQNAINLHQQQHQQQQQQQQQMATAAAVNSFFQSAPIAPNSGLSIATSMAAPISKSTSTSAFHTVTPANLSPAVGTRSTTTTITTSTSSPSSNGLLSPPLKPSMDNLPLMPTPVMPLRPHHTNAFSTPPSLSFATTATPMVSVPASPAAALPAHSLLSPVRPAAQMAYGTAGALHQALAGMSGPPLYLVRQ